MQTQVSENAEPKRGTTRTGLVAAGVVSGILNGLFGAGGGVVAVPMLSHAGLDARRAHATSVAVILPASAVSAVLYVKSGALTWGDALPYLSGGLLGAGLGALFLRRISVTWLRLVFAGILAVGAVRMLFA